MVNVYIVNNEENYGYCLWRLSIGDLYVYKEFLDYCISGGMEIILRLEF